MKQTEGSETANASFDLGAATMEYGNNAPYFTWGRKDPMVPSTGLASAQKAIYGTYTTFNNINTTDIATTIRIPYKYNTGYGNPSHELWNVGSTATNINVNPVVKSIYDPSPPGFHLPPSGAFQGWSESKRSYFQSMTGQSGRYFYQLGPAIGNAIFFPCLGSLSSSTQRNFVNQAGRYWSAGAASTSMGFSLIFTTSEIDPKRNLLNYVGNSIRPVLE